MSEDMQRIASCSMLCSLTSSDGRLAEELREAQLALEEENKELWRSHQACIVCLCTMPDTVCWQETREEQDGVVYLDQSWEPLPKDLSLPRPDVFCVRVYIAAAR